MQKTTLAQILAMAALTTASPIACSSKEALTSSLLTTPGIATSIKALPCSTNITTNTITAQNLVTIAPSTASCADASYADECRTASIAAPHIAISFKQFKLTTFGAQAAAVAIQLYESGDFKYSKNHFPVPGRPGQGTRNMQSPAFNEMYAEYLTGVSGSGVTKTILNTARAKGVEDVLALVNTDRWSFGSAAWFIGTQCSDTVRQGLDAGTLVGFETYLTECVGTTATENRIEGWQKVTALKKW